MPPPHLPTEILLKVFSHLAVPPGSYSEDGKYRHDNERAISRRTLLTLTRSGNRRLYQAASRYLYHTVVLDSLDSFFLFLRTIVRADDLAKRVRVLWVATLLFRESLGDLPAAESESIIAGITSDLPAYAYLPRCFGDLSGPDNFRWGGGPMVGGRGWFGQSACCLLLCLVTKVETLFLTYSETKRWAYTYRSLAIFLERSYRDGLPLLPSLRSLSLSALRNPNWMDSILSMFPPPSDFTVLLGSGKVEHLELYNLDLQDGDFEPEQWAAVESLRCWSVGPELSWALQRMHQHARPSLKKLDIALAHSQEYTGLFLADRHLDRSIALFADTLESLRITITPGTTPPLLRRGLMDCLVALSHLRELDVSATLLFPDESAMELADIRTLLPASLEKVRFDETELESWDVWRIQWGKPWGFQRALKEIFLALVWTSGERLPRLRTVEVAMCVEKGRWGVLSTRGSSVVLALLRGPRRPGGWWRLCVAPPCLLQPN